jgi:hypothetical protein
MKTYKIQPGIIHQFVDEEAVVISNADAMITSLNQTAADIFRWLLEGPADQASLLDRMLLTYDIDAETAAADLTEILQDFEAHKLVVVQ